MSEALSCPRLLVAGLGGGSGKTMVSLGLARALREDGLTVQTFKKGPDYIDAQWLALATGQPTSNLDPFLLSSTQLLQVVAARTAGKDVLLVEGNRGLFDGKDVQGSCSSAELARLLHCPVVVVLDCTKVTRTMAAVVLGLVHFDPQLTIGGVILNRTAGCRHRMIVRQSIETYTDVPVLGELPKLKDNPIPERHMGLTSHAEWSTDVLAGVAATVREHVDIAACLRLARSASVLPLSSQESAPLFVPRPFRGVRIGVALDAALWFYYQENIDALRAAGAEIVPFSLLRDQQLPSLHALYLGGGFPETLAQGLSANVSMRESVRRAVDRGMPVYAECGGLMYLARELHFQGKTYPMSGALPFATTVCSRPQGHGYVVATVIAPSPFFRPGTRILGHEFHYSCCMDLPGDANLVLQLDPGVGMAAGRDGVVWRNVFASYTHIHAVGVPSWADAMVEAAEAFADCPPGEALENLRRDA